MVSQWGLSGLVCGVVPDVNVFEAFGSLGFGLAGVGASVSAGEVDLVGKRG